MTTTTRILKSFPKCNYYDYKYIISHTIYDNNKYNFLCWKSKCLFNIYLDDYSYYRKVFALDFNITKDMLKIKHLSINNDYYDKNSITNYDENKLKLTDEETKEVKIFVFDLIKNIAIKKNVNKIVIDVHSNLNRYNYELKNEGFITNHDVKCYTNPYWIRAEKALI
jgi:hypothetical protein